MFGTEEGARIISRELLSVPAVTGVINQRVFVTPIWPGDQELPGVILTPLASDHSSTINSDGEPVTETVQYEVAFTVEGLSSDPIRPAAKAGMKHLRQNGWFEEEIDGDIWTLAISSLGGLPRVGFANEHNVYRQLGGVLLLEFNKVG